MEQLIVAQAKEHFAQGNYQAAKSLFEKAQARYGNALFEVNIKLCLDRLARAAKTVPQSSGLGDDAVSAEQQLIKTQALLEEYYTKYQEAVWRLRKLDQKGEL
ncbi:hypothetical protein [uncultured Gilvimarinus sp.]|uniref:hypothetical protein n=1 Tax=uncultured Gilvimarinus sp. TaxID=1689143 RepID=UPI0030EF8A84|tara:strand:- start:2878 stop:3186 length:309 start_codon:yes stop_codon:yes gene_type:complete